MPNVYQIIRSHNIEPTERCRAAVRLTLVLLGLICTIGFRSLDGYLSEQQTARVPMPYYQSDFGSEVAAVQSSPQTLAGSREATYAF